MSRTISVSFTDRQGEVLEWVENTVDSNLKYSSRSDLIVEALIEKMERDREKLV